MQVCLVCEFSKKMQNMTKNLFLLGKIAHLAEHLRMRFRCQRGDCRPLSSVLTFWSAADAWAAAGSACRRPAAGRRVRRRISTWNLNLRWYVAYSFLPVGQKLSEEGLDLPNNHLEFLGGSWSQCRLTIVEPFNHIVRGHRRFRLVTRRIPVSESCHFYKTVR
jgi:hypothetical protein